MDRYVVITTELEPSRPIKHWEDSSSFSHVGELEADVGSVLIIFNKFIFVIFSRVYFGLLHLDLIL